jgi:hypothetical protein
MIWALLGGLALFAIARQLRSHFELRQDVRRLEESHDRLMQGLSDALGGVEQMGNPRAEAELSVSHELIEKFSDTPATQPIENESPEDPWHHAVAFYATVRPRKSLEAFHGEPFRVVISSKLLRAHAERRLYFWNEIVDTSQEPEDDDRHPLSRYAIAH